MAFRLKRKGNCISEQLEAITARDFTKSSSYSPLRLDGIIKIFCDNFARNNLRESGKGRATRRACVHLF